MNFTWAMLLGLIGLVGIVIAQGFLGKKGTRSSTKSRKVVTWIGVIVLAVGLIPAFGIWSPIPAMNNAVDFNTLSVGGTGTGNGTGTGATTGQVTQQLPSGFCPGIEDTTVKLSSGDAYNGTATGGTHRYRISSDNGVSWGPSTTVSDAGTFTASPGDKLQILWYNGATTGYFSAVSTETVPCKGTFDPTQKLSSNGSLTTTFLNTDGQPITGTTGVNQTLGVGDVKDVTMKINGQFQKDFPYGFVAVFDYNATEIDGVTLTSNGAELPIAVVPQSYTTLNPTVDKTKAYLISSPLLSNAEQDYKVTIDSDDTYNPGAGPGDANVTVTLYARNDFLNEKAGGIFDGPSAEDEQNTLTRPLGVQDQIFYG